MKVAFAGTPEFARAALERLQGAGFDIPLVLTQPDRPAGRGMKLQASAVKHFAQLHGLPLSQPRGLRLDGRWADDAALTRRALEAVRPDVLVVAAYGLILPRWALVLPRHGALNIHASLLPRWRGAAPIQRAIEAGDTHTGVTIMQMDEGLDTGAMLMSERLAIAADDSAATLHDRLAPLGARLIVEALEALACGGLTATPQPVEGVTYAPKIEKAEAPIDWTAPADLIERRVRAFDPFPGASFDDGGQTVKLWRARLAREIVAGPGQLRVEGDRVFAGCGDGALELMELQRPGARRLPAAAWLQGRRSGG